ncbi:MAG: hypothetical protein WAO00_08305 [Chthoniobacterales bacterium]
MPLDTAEDYERLGAHLTEIDPVLIAFAETHGYTLYRKGRYPNRHITHEGPVIRSIQISMGLTPDGGTRFEDFFPAIPYDIFGAAWIDDHASHTRWSSPSIQTWAIPFSTLVHTLSLHLNHFHDYLSGFTESRIMACAIVSPLGFLPPDLNLWQASQFPRS